MRRKLGSLDCAVLGGTDGKGGGDGALVVLCHGFGAGGDDLVSLARVIRTPPGTRFVFPAAPLRLEMGLGDARAWWMIDIERFERAAAGGARDPALEFPDGLPAARAALVSCLDACASELGARSERTILGGFSQGAMLACDVMLHDPRRLAGVVLLSGTLLAESEWTPLMPTRKGLKVFQSHGTNDPLLPYTDAERLRDRLREAGVLADFVGFRGGHEIPSAVLMKLDDFIGEVLGSSNGRASAGS